MGKKVRGRHMIIEINLDDKRVKTIVNDDIAVFIDEIYEFDDDENYHPYFEKSYQIGIARIHDYELPDETSITLDDLEFFRGKDILKQKQEIEKIAEKIIRYAKKLVDSIDELYRLVPPSKLREILANVNPS